MKIPYALIILCTCAFSASGHAAGSSGSGKQLYDQSCAMCHGTDGKGGIPGAGDMTSTNGPMAQPDAVLIKHVLDGYGKMPPYKGQLSKEQTAAIIAYMRKAFGVKPHQ